MSVSVETLRPAALDPRAEQQMVPMRDGVRLATDTYLPPGHGRWPTVLVRLPYDKNGRYTFMPHLAAHVTARGYAFVVQDVRGRFRSEGETVPFVHEVDDGYDTIEWIVDQQWANGAVGMFGDSYYGFTQWAAVASGHPALRAIVPRVTAANLGLWLQGEVDPLYGGRYLAEVWSDRHMHSWPIDWSRRPLATVFDPGFELIGSRSAGLEMLLDHSRQNRQLDPFLSGHPFARLSIPTLHVVGWFDNISPDSMRDYMRLSRDPRIGQLQYLLADSTDHENYHLEHVPVPDELDHDKNDAALERMLPRYLGPALDFFDVFLAGTRDPATLPRVRWHLGNDGWRESERWPPAGADQLELYLTDAEAATRDAAGGSLCSAPEREQAVVSWTHDAQNLVPSTVEDPFAFLLEWPDEREIESRPDVLTFTGEPLVQALDLAGPVTATLTLRTDGPSMHVFVKLIDVFPDGRAVMLLRGQSTVERGDPNCRAEVYLGHTGYRVPAGHRLRLHIASSDFPLYVAHPGTAENPWFATNTMVNRQGLLTGGRSPSFLSLTTLTAAERGC
jgi:predicted acyl esterase